MHTQQVHVLLDIVVLLYIINRNIKLNNGNFVFKELHSHMVNLLWIFLDQTGSVLTVELVQLQHAQLTQLNQDIAPLAIHQLNALLVSLAFHTTQLKTLRQIIVLSAKLDLVVQQSVMVLKFHFLMLYVCLMIITLLFLMDGKDMPITLHTHQCISSLAQPVLSMLMVIWSLQLSQILQISNG